MNGPEADVVKEKEAENDSVFKIPEAKNAPIGQKKKGQFSAQYCNEVMNSDSIKPFNSGNKLIANNILAKEAIPNNGVRKRVAISQ